MAQHSFLHFPPPTVPGEFIEGGFLWAHFYVSRLSFRARIAFYQRPLPHVPERSISFLLPTIFVVVIFVLITIAIKILFNRHNYNDLIF